jgi:energy-coupling factor transporter ATP-binding protein EcfA2
VGLIYGPSGCGKSSLVKAGLLPWLAKRVVAVYIEATAEDTESLPKVVRKPWTPKTDIIEEFVELTASPRRHPPTGLRLIPGSKPNQESEKSS